MATRNEVYAKFGITAEAAQLFETELGTILLVLEALDKGWYAEQNEVAATEFARTLDKYMLGQALKRARTKMDVSVDIEESFGNALNSRNRLCHGFYLHHGNRIQTDEGRALMIEDLERHHDILFRAWRIASDMSAVLVGHVLPLMGLSDALPSPARRSDKDRPSTIGIDIDVGSARDGWQEKHRHRA